MYNLILFIFIYVPIMYITFIDKNKYEQESVVK